MVAPVTAVIVTYRSMRTIPHTLRTLHGCHQAGLLDCVVVDNDSNDGTADWVEREHPWVTVVRAGANLGFGRGNNLGLTRTRSPFVLFLNPDAAIDAPDLRTLLEFFEAHPQAGILGPAINNSGSFDQPALPFPTLGSTLRESLPGFGPQIGAVLDPSDPPRKVDWICGAILLARRAVVDRLQGFDPRFFLYFEETDLCYRARQAGYETWAVPTAVGEHVPGTSAKSTDKRLFRGCIAEHYFRSRFYFNVKHYGRLGATVVEALELVLTALRLPLRMVLGRDTTEFKIRLRAPFFRMPDKPREAPAVSGTPRTSSVA
jgi:hypothetical protein